MMILPRVLSMRIPSFGVAWAVWLWIILPSPIRLTAAEPPNVIIVMTDDQGYGDLSCHGNPIVKTPHLDHLYSESVRCTNFHVSPFCTPTRAALMTGRYPGRTGAYRTSSGRTMMHRDERTMAHLFAENGYATGMVGKWHLGDNAPHRPQDRGFEDVVWHRCGGVGQASDYWGNDYFDDHYERNGSFEKFEGYCTDVWFAEAQRFIQENRDRPFFLYLAPNAPHGPYRVPPQWSQPYQSKVPWRAGAEFYGMVANIDYNVGQLRRQLDALGLADNTIFVFLTDNGTANGAQFRGLDSEPEQGFNANMRGKKSSIYEGGHRVPCFIRFPIGDIGGGRDLDDLAAHIDLLPTLAELCQLDGVDTLSIDGLSFAPALRSSLSPSARDHLVVQFQGGAHFREAPQPWRDSCILSEHWRLINGEELYNIASDPAQRTDLSDQHPDRVTALRARYRPFWESVSQGMTPVPIELGSPAENPVRLCSQDWYLPSGNPPWNFGQIQRLPKVTGPWKVDVKRAGRYRIALMQLPREADSELKECVRAKIEIAGLEREATVEPGSKQVVFNVELPVGRTDLLTYLYSAEGTERGAYYCEVALQEQQ